MADKKPISQAAQRFVDRKLEQLKGQAAKGCGLYYELYSQNFTDSVDRLAARAKRADLREHILSEAQKTGDYFGEEARKGRWVYDVEAGDIHWQGEPLDWMKKADRALRTSAAQKYGASEPPEREMRPPSRSR